MCLKVVKIVCKLISPCFVFISAILLIGYLQLTNYSIAESACGRSNPVLFFSNLLISSSSLRFITCCHCCDLTFCCQLNSVSSCTSVSAHHWQQILLINTSLKKNLSNFCYSKTLLIDILYM